MMVPRFDHATANCRDLSIDEEEEEEEEDLDPVLMPTPDLRRPASCSELHMALQNADTGIERVPSHSQIAA